MLPMSVGTAVNTGIANALGAGVAASARRFFYVGIAVVACIQVGGYASDKVPSFSLWHVGVRSVLSRWAIRHPPKHA
jgi:hypothetical protein